MTNGQIDNNHLIAVAWEKTKERWKDYIIIFLQYIAFPIFIAALVSSLVLLLFSVIGATVRTHANAGVVNYTIVAGVVIISTAAFLFALYRTLLGAIAMVKIIVDPHNDRGKVVAESKKLVRPYAAYIVLLSLLNSGFLVYAPLTLFTIGVFVSVWSHFAMFSFLEDDKKGAYNIWKGVTVLKMHFWTVTGQTIILLLIGGLVSNAGNLIQFLAGRDQSIATIQAVSSAHLLSFVFSVIFHIFSIAYLYELYKHLSKPAHVKAPRLWLFFSLLGWVIIIGVIYLIFKFLNDYPSILYQMHR